MRLKLCGAFINQTRGWLHEILARDLAIASVAATLALAEPLQESHPEGRLEGCSAIQSN